VADETEEVFALGQRSSVLPPGEIAVTSEEMLSDTTRHKRVLAHNETFCSDPSLGSESYQPNRHVLPFLPI
jgi:hypothetical protein